MNKDVNQFFVGLFKEPLNAMLVAWVVLIAVGVYFWMDFQAYASEYGRERAVVKERNFYKGVAGVAVFSCLVLGELYRRARKRAKFKKYLKRIGRDGNAEASNR